MSNSDGVSLLRLRQLRAIAENLCTLAKRHRENHNYVVAAALYDRALLVAQEIHDPEDCSNVFAARIRTAQLAVLEMQIPGEASLEQPPLEKAQHLGR